MKKNILNFFFLTNILKQRAIEKKRSNNDLLINLLINNKIINFINLYKSSDLLNWKNKNHKSDKFEEIKNFNKKKKYLKILF